MVKPRPAAKGTQTAIATLYPGWLSCAGAAAAAASASRFSIRSWSFWSDCLAADIAVDRLHSISRGSLRDVAVGIGIRTRSKF